MIQCLACGTHELGPAAVYRCFSCNLPLCAACAAAPNICCDCAPMIEFLSLEELFAVLDGQPYQLRARLPEIAAPPGAFVLYASDVPKAFGAEAILIDTPGVGGQPGPVLISVARDVFEVLQNEQR